MSAELLELDGVGLRVDRPARVEPGPWADKFLSPPPDIAVAISPATGRRAAATAVSEHILEQLEAGRSLYCIVHDPEVQAHLGGFDGRALPEHCLGVGQ
jgi:hypothetical protein